MAWSFIRSLHPHNPRSTVGGRGDHLNIQKPLTRLQALILANLQASFSVIVFSACLLIVVVLHVAL